MNHAPLAIFALILAASPVHAQDTPPQSVKISPPAAIAAPREHRITVMLEPRRPADQVPGFVSSLRPGREGFNSTLFDSVQRPKRVLQTFIRGSLPSHLQVTQWSSLQAKDRMISLEYDGARDLNSIVESLRRTGFFSSVVVEQLDFSAPVVPNDPLYTPALARPPFDQLNIGEAWKNIQPKKHPRTSKVCREGKSPRFWTRLR